MSIKSNLTKAIGLGVVVTALTAGGAFAAVATSSANVHSGPGIKFHTVDRIHAGDWVRITDRAGGWCEVRGDADGWVNCGVLTDGRMNDYPRVSARTAITTATTTMARASASASARMARASASAAGRSGDRDQLTSDR